MLEVEVWGVRIFKVEITKKAHAIIISKIIIWIIHLIHLVFQVIWQFYQRIYPGWLWQGIISIFLPKSFNSSGMSVQHKQNPENFLNRWRQEFLYYGVEKDI